jgi:hypothetical protein
MSIGRYKGIDYKKQRICDVLAVDTKAQWWFTYIDGEPLATTSTPSPN